MKVPCSLCGTRKPAEMTCPNPRCPSHRERRSGSTRPAVEHPGSGRRVRRAEVAAGVIRYGVLTFARDHGVVPSRGSDHEHGAHHH